MLNSYPVCLELFFVIFGWKWTLINLWNLGNFMPSGDASWRKQAFSSWQLMARTSNKLIHNSYDCRLVTKMIYFCNAYWKSILYEIYNSNGVDFLIQLMTNEDPESGFLTSWCALTSLQNICLQTSFDYSIVVLSL